MAKILPGIAVSKMSGTIGGTTYSNWRGILVARSKPTPTNVNTPRQSFVRSLLSTLSKAWRDELTPGLRQAWNNRASTYPWLDVFGNSVNMTGENLYIKQNFVLLDHSLARQDTPVPDTNPPEIDDIEQTSAGHYSATFSIPGLPAAVVNSQAPFLAISLAGGYLTLNDETNPDSIEVETHSQLLAPGRKHQKSDFRVLGYFNHAPINEATPVNGALAVSSTIESPRALAVIMQRFNKYGNFSAPRMFTTQVEPVV